MVILYNKFEADNAQYLSKWDLESQNIETPILVISGITFHFDRSVQYIKMRQTDNNSFVRSHSFQNLTLEIIPRQKGFKKSDRISSKCTQSSLVTM